LATDHQITQIPKENTLPSSLGNKPSSPHKHRKKTRYLQALATSHQITQIPNENTLPLSLGNKPSSPHKHRKKTRYLQALATSHQVHINTERKHATFKPWQQAIKST
jgi:hypothetical protein